MGTRTKPNWLFRILIIISLGIHVLIFARISGVFTSHNRTFIELTLQDISNPHTRMIPRPRYRPKKPPKPEDIKKIKITKMPAKFPKPVKMKAMEADYNNELVENIDGGKFSFSDDLGLAAWDPNLEPFVEYETTDSYLEMILLKIQRAKKYPKSAETMHIEGRIIVRFIVTTKGTIEKVEIIKKSRYEVLNEAALAAVKNAAPFQKPPLRLFKEDLTVMVPIRFELN